MKRGDVWMLKSGTSRKKRKRLYKEFRGVIMEKDKEYDRQKKIKNEDV